MHRTVKTILLALIVVGGLWVLANQEQIQQAGGMSAYLSQTFGRASQNGNSQYSNGGFQTAQFQSTPYGRQLRDSVFSNTSSNLGAGQTQPFQLPRSTSDRSYLLANTGLPPRRKDAIRIASFKLNVNSNLDRQPGSLNLMSHLCSQFDIIAFQEINRSNAAWMEQLGQKVASQSNGAIQFRAISDATRVAPGDPQFVILYNSQTLDLDFAHWYSVNDPDQLLKREPLVGWFRTRGLPSEQAFTFTLANIEFDDHRPDLELAYLDELFRAIRLDGRGEDDVIITGNFNAGDRGLAPLRRRAGLTWVVYDTATTTDKDSQFDNLVFAQNATVEFTGQGGVHDFLATYNLPLDQARAISEHMPIWAEFSTSEGRLTPQPSDGPSPQ